MPEPIALKYRAFLSYSHVDTPIAKWLHRTLEAFRIGTDMVGRSSPRGPVPATLRPIFRDRDEFTAGDALASQTLTALDLSHALIVLCSPASARSAYVNEEIRLFKWRHPDLPVIPVIANGRPGSAEAGCFPPALRFEIDADGRVSDRPVALLAADLQDSGDGRDLAVAKVVGRLTGLATDEIFRRAERDRKRRLRRWVAALSTATAAFAVIAGVALVQLYQVETARRLADAQSLAQRQPTEALLALAETKDRWLADKSLLPRLTPALVGARLTLARQIIGESTSGIAWLPDGGYVAASTDGQARQWSQRHRLIATVPARRVATESERHGFGKGRVPLSSAWPIDGGKSLATLDWRDCIRLVPLAALAEAAADDSVTQHCINKNAEGGEPEYLAAAIHADGTIAIARAGLIEMRGASRTDVALPPDRAGQVSWIKFGPTGDVAIGFKDEAIGWLARDRRSVDMLEPHETSGFCSDGSLWAAAAGGLLTRLDGAARSTKKLAGKSPWTVSAGCTLYVDGNGDLYHLDDGATPLKRGVAEGWQYSARARKLTTSKSERYLAISTNDGRIAVYDLVDDVVLDLLGHTQRVFGMVFDEQETRLLTSSFDGTVRVFSLNESLIADAGTFDGAQSVYSAADGGPVVSSKGFDYLEFSRHPLSSTIELPGQPSGAPVVVRHDWRIGENHVLADGDTQFVAICTTARCPDGSVVRELKADFIGSGGNTNAKVSGDGEFLAAYDDGRAVNIFDLRKSGELPVLSFSYAVTSLAFDAKAQTIYMMSGDRLGIMPFGARELSDQLAKTVKFCLTAGERQLLFSEGTWLAQQRAAQCEAGRQ